MGLNALWSYILYERSSKQQLGRDIKECVNRIVRCQHGSKGQQVARRALRQRIDEVAREITQEEKIDLIVMEKLSNLNYKSKQNRRLFKSTRRVVGAWIWRHWLTRMQMDCEESRTSFRSVPCYNTSITCRVCGCTDKRNRQGEIFLCISCNHRDNADNNAGGNILDRFIRGPYGASYKPIDLLLGFASAKPIEFGALSNA